MKKHIKLIIENNNEQNLQITNILKDGSFTILYTTYTVTPKHINIDEQGIALQNILKDIGDEDEKIISREEFEAILEQQFSK